MRDVVIVFVACPGMPMLLGLMHNIGVKMTFLATIGAITIARILFLAIRQFCRDWGKGYDSHKYGAY